MFSTVSLMATACSWCGIIICAKPTSASLNSAAVLAGAVDEGAVVARSPMGIPDMSLPQPANTAAARAIATIEPRTGREVM